MAQIDFSAGYRDATKGATLKALALRRQQAAEEQATAMQPRQIASPWQGAAQIAETIGGGIREGRAAAQETAGRQRFAELLAGGLSPEEMGEATTLDPEIAMQYQTHQWDVEKTAETRKQELIKHGWDIDAATERARVEAEQQTRLFGHEDVKQEDVQAEARTTAETAAETARIKAEQDAEIANKAAQRDAALAPDFAKLDAAAAAGTMTPEEVTTQKELLARKAEADIAQSMPEQIGPMTPELAAKWGIAEQDRSKYQVNAKTGEPELISPVQKPGDVMSPGAQEIDKKAGPEVLEWKQIGGANAIKAVKDTRTAINILETRGGSGFAAGVAEAALPEPLTKLVNPDGTIAQDSIRNTVQMTLRPILGAQFTQQEGEALMKRAFDINMTPQENIRRAKLILEQVEQIAASKQDMADYWDSHGGSIYGWSPKPVDFNALKTMFTEEEQAPGAGGAGGAATDDYQEGDVVSSPGQPDLILKNGKWVPK